jgi:uncharacterized protein (DUF1810 family)
MTSDPHNLQRFVDAQHPIYGQVRDELQGGKKETHWMWFIFPQIRGLGSSLPAQNYAIQSLAEANAYLDHPLLGFRLRECTHLVNAINDRPIENVFGFPDNLKFHSSMTLFSEIATADPGFAAALDKYFDGKKDPKTLKLL